MEKARFGGPFLFAEIRLARKENSSGQTGWLLLSVRDKPACILWQNCKTGHNIIRKDNIRINCSLLSQIHCETPVFILAGVNFSGLACLRFYPCNDEYSPMTKVGFRFRVKFPKQVSNYNRVLY